MKISSSLLPWTMTSLFPNWKRAIIAGQVMSILPIANDFLTHLVVVSPEQHVFSHFANFTKNLR